MAENTSSFTLAELLQRMQGKSKDEIVDEITDTVGMITTLFQRIEDIISNSQEIAVLGGISIVACLYSGGSPDAVLNIGAPDILLKVYDTLAEQRVEIEKKKEKLSQ